MTEDWVNKRKIAEHMGVSTRTIARWMYLAVNPIPFHKPWEGAPPRFLISECDRWYAGHTATANPSAGRVRDPITATAAASTEHPPVTADSKAMSAWTRRITHEQEQAVYVAVLDQGMSAAAAARAAAEGTLPGVGKFTISAATAQRYVRAEKERRARQRQLAPEHWDDTQAQLEREIRGWLLDGMSEIREGRNPRVNLDSARAAMRLLKELRAPGYTRPPRIPGEPGQEHQDPETTPQGEPETNGLLQRLRIATADAHDETHEDAASSARSSSEVAHTHTREEGSAPC